MSELVRVCGRCGQPVPDDYPGGGTITGCRRCRFVPLLHCTKMMPLYGKPVCMIGPADRADMGWTSNCEDCPHG